MKTLAIDLETYSGTDLLKSGVYRYAEDPDFEILLMAYSYDGEPAQIIDLTEEALPGQILQDLTNPGVLKTAYNANFERACLAAFFGLEIDPEQWQDTMVLAAELGLPRSLADVGKVIGLSEDQQKIKEGRALIQYFSKPCKPTKTNGGRTRNMPRHAPEKWEAFKTYCQRDVDTEQAIRTKLLRFGVNQEEQDLWYIDQKINDRGVGLDLGMASAAAELDSTLKAELLQEAKDLTGMANPKSVSQIKNWILEETGQEIKSLEKREMARVLQDLDGCPKVLSFLELRKEFNKTSTAKYEAMLRCVSGDGRIRGLTQFYGANRTGRWAGRNVQMQNLPQNHLPDEDLDLARQLVKAGDLEALKALYEPGDTLSQLIRTAFIPRPGYKFIVSDFSAIEARVLAWLAGEKWRLDVFNTHGKIYEASAEQMFNLPAGSVKKGDPMRTKGKIAELALGYGGSAGAMKRMGALENGLTEEELMPTVNSWRRANPAITMLWSKLDGLVRELLRSGAPQIIDGEKRLKVYRQGPVMRLRLPSQRTLSYVRPRIDGGSITYEGIYQQAGGWGRQDTYGAKLVENITQAVARDCLAVAMKRLDAKGIQVVFHVHDEVICEVKDDGKVTADTVAQIMAEPIAWAQGLPLKADAYECHYYRKD